MLKKYLRKNIDLIVLILVGGLIYAAGWQAEVFGFVQRGILATGLLDAQVEKVDSVQKANLNFQIYDVEGQMIHAESLRGKTVFINFWATWCPPCLAEMPGIEKLYEQMKDDEDVVFLMISVDENREKGPMHSADKPKISCVYWLQKEPKEDIL